MKNKIGISNKRKYISIELLNSFSDKELEGFSNFISYYYFNADKSLVKLFEQLKKYVIGKPVQLFNYEVKIYNNVFSDLEENNKINIKQRKRLNSKLTAITRLAEKFLCINALDKSNFCKKELLYDELLNKKQYELFNRKINSDKRELKQIELKDSSFYYQAHKIEEYIFTSNYQNDLIALKNNLKEQKQYLDLYYILEKLSIYISMLSIGITTQKVFDYETIEPLWDLVDSADYKNIPLVKAYKFTILLLKNQTITEYNKLIDLLNEFRDVLPAQTLITLYNVALNFCIKQLSTGKFTFFDLFEIYNKLDEQNLFLEENLMPVSKLKNVLTIGCRTGNFKWAQHILTKYYSFIRKPVRESVNQFNLGLIAFYKKNFDAALKHFIKVDKVSLTYDVDCRIMMLKAHYEIDKEYDERTVQIYRSTEKYFVESKALSSSNKKAYKNFVRMLINLYRIKHKETKMTAESFSKKLDTQQFNSDKNWLIGKLKEIGI